MIARIEPERIERKDIVKIYCHGHDRERSGHKRKAGGAEQRNKNKPEDSRGSMM